MIMWYCDICGKLITDGDVLRYLGGPIWEVCGVANPIYHTGKGEGEIYMKVILCKGCKADLISQTHNMIQQMIKDKRDEETGDEMAEEE